MVKRRKSFRRIAAARKITATDLAQERMGRNKLQGDDQLSVRNQRRAQPGATKRVPGPIETMEEADPRVRARRARSRKRTSKQGKEANVPARSKKQQMAAGAALSAKRGERSKKSLRGASKQMAKSMSKSELRKMAKTKRKKLPKRASKS